MRSALKGLGLVAALGLAASGRLQGAGEAADFRNLVPGARAAGLGGAIVAQPGLDGGALNPAAIGFAREGSIQASHLALVQDLSVEQLMMAWPVGFGSLGADLRFLQAPDLMGLDANGQLTGSSVPTHEASYGLLWGGQWRVLCVGLGVNLVSLDLANTHGQGWSLDGGVQWALPAGLRLGASLRNGGWLDPVAGAADALPAEGIGGLSWSGGLGSESATLSLQGQRQGQGAWVGVAGLELGLGGVAFLRASYTPLQPLGQAGPWTGGVGAHLGPVDLDGAWIPYGELGNTFRASATLYPARWAATVKPANAFTLELKSLSAGAYSLRWEPQPGAKGYQVYRRSSADGDWIKVTQQAVRGTHVTLKGLGRVGTKQLGVSLIGPDGSEGDVVSLVELP